MISRLELKNRALRTIEGKVFKFFLVFFIVGSISFILQKIILGDDFTRYLRNEGNLPSGKMTIIQIINFFLALFDFGVAKLFLNAIKTDRINYSDIVVSFTSLKTFGRNLILILLRFVLIFLFLILLIIPGIIKAFAYSQSNYVANDKPELTAKQCLDLSEDMMKGHKMNFFILMLSFIGWTIIIIITLGLAIIYVAPYMMATTAHFYNYLKIEYALTHPDVFPDLIKKEEQNNHDNNNPPPVFEELK